MVVTVVVLLSYISIVVSNKKNKNQTMKSNHQENGHRQSEQDERHLRIVLLDTQNHVLGKVAP